MAIQAVFFDMGGTIETLFHDESLRLAATAQLRQYLAEQGLDPGLSHDDLYRIIQTGLDRYNTWKEQSLIELEPARVWQEYIFTDLDLPQAKLAAVAEQLTFLLETTYYRREMRPEVPRVLEAIRQMGLRTGVISNVVSRGQVPYSLQLYGIADCFDTVVLSSVYGRRKPDPHIFWHAARLIGAPPEACVHVGDTISRDVLGARRAGYRLAVRIEHPPLNSQDSQAAVPDVVISNMLELLDVLEKEDHVSSRNTITTSPAARSIKAVLFDAGDLLYYRPRRGQYLTAFLAELGLSPSSAPGPARETMRGKAMRGEISRQAYQDVVLRGYGIQSEDDLARGRQVLEAESADVVFFDGVQETLLSLKRRGYLLGIVTDTFQPTSVKQTWLERAGIGHVWDTFVSSCEVGVCKPDPRIYRIALDELGIAPQEAIFVGHKATELRGARGVGMMTVAFNHDKDAEADFYIEHFAELLQLPVLVDG